jgi:hypothetical protein
MPNEMPNMCCPLCGERLQTKDSRPASYNRFGPAVRRRRACTGCGWRCTTYEVMDSALIQMEAQLSASMRAVHQAYDALGALIAAYDEIPDGSRPVAEQQDVLQGPHPAGG